MKLNNIFSDKKISNEKIKKIIWIPIKYKPLWLVILKNREITEKLIEWLKVLCAWFVIYIENTENKNISDNLFITKKIDNFDLLWYDFIICDNEILNINKYLENWVIPIIIKDSYLNSIFQEFNPMKNDWNAFLYEELNEWQIFYALVRYLENYKFPFDNKNLVENVLKI